MRRVRAQAEKARSDALVQRMSGLLACFPFKGKGAGKDKKEHEPAIPEGGAKIESAIHEADEAFGEPPPWTSQRLASQRPLARSRRLCGTLRSLARSLGRSAAGRMEVIDAVRRTLNHMNIKQSNDDQVEIVQAIGEGTVSSPSRRPQRDDAASTTLLPSAPHCPLAH